MPSRHHKLHFRLAVAMGALALLLPLLAMRLAYEWQGPFTADSPIYWAMGRGILNGLVPYRDLFETKPPGMFLISALSFAVTGDLRLDAWLQTLMIALLPVTITAAALVRKPDLGRGVVAACVGTLLALYVAERSGEFQVESFGAAFASVAILGMMRSREGFMRGSGTLLVIGFVGAIGMKEPFALSLLACGLLLSDDGVHLRRHVARPMILTALIGVAALVALGYMGPYVSVYLREMLGSHIGEGESLLQRTMHVERLARDVWMYSPLLLTVIGFAWMTLLYSEIRSCNSRAGLLAILGRHAGALLLASLAVGMGSDYFNHHFVFAVPVYAAVAAKMLGSVEYHWREHHTVLQTAVAALCLAAIPTLPVRDYAADLRFMQGDMQRMEHDARAIDAMLDACGEDRYVFLGDNGPKPYGLTTHSPAGPYFFQYDYFVNGDRPAFERAIMQNVAEANIVVQSVDPPAVTTHDMDVFLAVNFTEAPWPCARETTLDGRYRILFRRNASPR